MKLRLCQQGASLWLVSAKPIGLVIAILLFGYAANGQAISNSTWYVSSMLNTDNGEELTRVSEFLITTDDTVLWKQDGGNKIYSFEVLSVSGVWNNLNEDGTVVYEVSRANLTGTLKFERDVHGYIITMDFRREGKNVMPYEFRVSEVNKL